VKGKINKTKCYTKTDTNDKDLKQIDLMNEPNTKDFGYTNVINEKKYKVYKRLVEGIPVILIKAFAYIFSIFIILIVKFNIFKYKKSIIYL
jgi:hypothetical protein